MAQAFDKTSLELFFAEELTVPLLRLTSEEAPPASAISVDNRSYRYVRSYPIKGHSAVLPAFLRERFAEGADVLLVERPTRYYVYLAA